MAEILIRVKAVCEQDYDGGCSGPSVCHEVVDIDTLLKEQHDYVLEVRGFALIDPKKGSISKRTADILRSHGWVHADTAKNREERKVMEQEYYILDEQGKHSYLYEPKFAKVNIDDLTDEQLKQLARSAKIVQVVGLKQALPPAQYKKLQTKRKQIEENKARLKAAAAKKAERKKAKEIAAAKKLLEEAGVTP